MSRVAASPRGAPARLTPRAPSTRRRSAGDGIEGVPRDDRTVVRFWHLWGSSPDARSRVTGSSRDSPYRDPQLLESRVRALARVFDERSGLTSPRSSSRPLELLTHDVAEVTRATVALKRCAPSSPARPSPEPRGSCAATPTTSLPHGHAWRSTWANTTPANVWPRSRRSSSRPPSPSLPRAKTDASPRRSDAREREFARTSLSSIIGM